MINKKLLLLATAGLLVSFSPAIGCVCPKTPDVAQSLHEASAVFVGKIVSKQKYSVRFKVIESWKGVSTKFVEIHTSGIRNDCEPRFEKGQTWLVYVAELPLFRSENAKVPYTVKLAVSSCSRTSKLTNANEDVTQLERAERRDAIATKIHRRKYKRGDLQIIPASSNSEAANPHGESIRHWRISFRHFPGICNCEKPSKSITRVLLGPNS